MSKVIKIKQSDIEKIVKNIVEGQEFDDLDSQIQPEELPQDDFDYEDDNDGSGVELTLAQSEDGTFYVLKNAEGKNPEVVTKTK